MTVIFSGTFCELGPSTKVTFAPNSQNSLAIAIPCFPEDLFPINLTGSIASKVGPAVTRTSIFNFFF